ncbi:MAG TPA: hypothetical protein VML96_09145 [Egibacteraceae bacterium]|nr:hypothetical protein [Egibacteraceae bacterium]
MVLPLPGTAPAVVAVPAPGSGPGYWAGAPSAVLDENGGFVLADGSHELRTEHHPAGQAPME